MIELSSGDEFTAELHIALGELMPDKENRHVVVTTRYGHVIAETVLSEIVIQQLFLTGGV